MKSKSDTTSPHHKLCLRSVEADPVPPQQIFISLANTFSLKTLDSSRSRNASTHRHSHTATLIGDDHCHVHLQYQPFATWRPTVHCHKSNADCNKHTTLQQPRQPTYPTGHPFVILDKENWPHCHTNTFVTTHLMIHHFTTCLEPRLLSKQTT